MLLQILQKRRRLGIFTFLLFSSIYLGAQMEPSMNIDMEADADQKRKLYVGTYSVRGSEGIYVYDFDLETGRAELFQTVSGRESPSFLTIHPNGRFLYAVYRSGIIEGKDWGSVAAYAIEAKSGRISILNEQSTFGAGACHVNTDRIGRLLMVSNYVGGNFAVYPIEKNGRIAENLANYQYEGNGPNQSRQEKPHLHYAMPSPDNRFAYAVDLGTDRLYAYRIKPKKNKLRPAKFSWATIDPGGGPRHFTFHPNGRWAYVAEELSSKVTAFRYQSKTGALEKIQRLSTLPEDFKEASFCADIHAHPNGRFLYVSNRGHNSLAIFSINQENGSLKLLDTPSVEGNWPRNFLITSDGRWCLIANERSDNIAIFTIDEKTGLLTFSDQEIKMPSPVCLKMGK